MLELRGRHVTGTFLGLADADEHGELAPEKLRESRKRLLHVGLVVGRGPAPGAPHAPGNAARGARGTRPHLDGLGDNLRLPALLVVVELRNEEEGQGMYIYITGRGGGLGVAHGALDDLVVCHGVEEVEDGLGMGL